MVAQQIGLAVVEGVLGKVYRASDLTINRFDSKAERVAHRSGQVAHTNLPRRQQSSLLSWSD